jgi:hypothetical protein
MRPHVQPLSAVPAAALLARRRVAGRLGHGSAAVGPLGAPQQELTDVTTGDETMSTLPGSPETRAQVARAMGHEPAEFDAQLRATGRVTRGDQATRAAPRHPDLVRWGLFPAREFTAEERRANREEYERAVLAEPCDRPAMVAQLGLAPGATWAAVVDACTKLRAAAAAADASRARRAAETPHLRVNAPGIAPRAAVVTTIPRWDAEALRRFDVTAGALRRGRAEARRRGLAWDRTTNMEKAALRTAEPGVFAALWAERQAEVNP